MVSLPGMGRASQQLSVYHDDSEVPVVLRVEMEGRDPLPVLMHVTNPSPTFEELSELEATQVVSIFTREELASSAFIKAIVCESPDVSISLIDVREQENPKAQLVEREYRFSVGWIQLPSTTESYNKLSLETNTGTNGSRHLGILSARRADTCQFSPNVVQLQAGKKEKELVLFRRLPEGTTWKLDASVELPAWLGVEWMDFALERRLVLHLQNESKLGMETQFLLPLENTNGFKTTLEIVARPSE